MNPGPHECKRNALASELQDLILWRFSKKSNRLLRHVIKRLKPKSNHKGSLTWQTTVYYLKPWVHILCKKKIVSAIAPTTEWMLTLALRSNIKHFIVNLWIGNELTNVCLNQGIYIYKVCFYHLFTIENLYRVQNLILHKGYVFHTKT